jgi:hypothetical protein
MPPLPPLNPDQIVAAIAVFAHAIVGFVLVNPLVAVFLLAAIAIVAELPPVILLIIVLLAVAYFLR